VFALLVSADAIGQHGHQPAERSIGQAGVEHLLDEGQGLRVLGLALDRTAQTESLVQRSPVRGNVLQVHFHFPLS
jgi:hypothetical protein